MELPPPFEPQIRFFSERVIFRNGIQYELQIDSAGIPCVKKAAKTILYYAVRVVYYSMASVSLAFCQNSKNSPLISDLSDPTFQVATVICSHTKLRSRFKMHSAWKLQLGSELMLVA